MHYQYVNIYIVIEDGYYEISINIHCWLHSHLPYENLNHTLPVITLCKQKEINKQIYIVDEWNVNVCDDATFNSIFGLIE